MALAFSYVLFSVLFSVPVMIFLCFLHRKKNYGKTRKLLPPGEMGYPWIGETMEFFHAQRKNQLFEEFVQPRVLKHGRIFKTSILGTPTVVVSGAEANKFFLSNEFKLVKSSWPAAAVQLMGKDSIMETEGERHRFIRGLLGTSLGFAGLEALVPRICQSVQNHLATEWLGKQELGLYRSTKILTFRIVCECLFGIHTEPTTLTIFERVLEGVFSAPVSFPGSKFYRANKARLEIQKMLTGVVRDMRKEMESSSDHGKGDNGMLLSKLVAALIRGEITEKEVVDNVVLLVFAAHDTTSFAIVMTFKMMAQHSDCYKTLLQEHMDIMSNRRSGEALTLEDIKKMKYTWQVARESMRLFPPIFGSFRKAITDIEYEGFAIPKGWKVLWTTHGTHYSEEYFKKPLSFNPSRFEKPMSPYVYVPFGGGPRVCAGSQLTKLNILIFVHYVVTKFDWSLVHPNEGITMDPLPFPSKGMPIKVSPKSPKRDTAASPCADSS